MIARRAGRLARAVLLVVVSASLRNALAQSSGEAPHWPLPLPALDARVADPGDNAAWMLSTRVDEPSLTVSASVATGAMAVTLRRTRHGHSTCVQLISQLLHTDAIDTFRTPSPAVFRGAPWEPSVFHQSSAAYDAEFGCLVVGSDVWVATAIASPRASGSLVQTSGIALQLARAVAASSTRRDYPLRLEVSDLEIRDPVDDEAWLYLGAARDFPIPSDIVALSPSDPGGATLSVGRRNGSCADAWQAFRPSLNTEGTLVDRPGYFPAEFGARVRRVTAQDRTREIACIGTSRGAVFVTMVFRTDDGEAMGHAAPMLRSIAAAVLESSAAPATTAHARAP